jgi:hypothetical protein
MPLWKKNLDNGAGWSSPVARRAHNPEVEGSNPSPATTTQGFLKTYEGFLQPRCHSKIHD